MRLLFIEGRTPQTPCVGPPDLRLLPPGSFFALLCDVFYCIFNAGNGGLGRYRGSYEDKKDSFIDWDHSVNDGPSLLSEE